MYRLWVTLLVAVVLVLVTALRPPGALATNRGKVIKRREANACKEGDALVRRRKSEGCGFESRCREKIFF